MSFRVASGTGSDCAGGRAGNLVTVSVTPTAPPTTAPAWCSVETDLSSPIVTTTTAKGDDPIVWAMGTNRLYAYDGVTGAELFAGGGAGDVLSTVQYFQSPIVAKGRVYVAANDRLYAFTP